MNEQLPVEEVIKKISEQKNLSIDEINKEIDKTIENLGGFLNRQGAAYLLAENYGVKLENESVSQTQTLEIKDLVPGMGPVTIAGRVRRIFPIKHFTSKDGNPNQVRRVELIDRTGDITCVIWGKKVFDIEEQKIALGDIMKIIDGEPRENNQGKIELSLSSRSVIEKNPKAVDTSNFPPLVVVNIMKISEITQEGEGITVAGKVIRKRGISEFTRKSDGQPGRVSGLTLQDTTGSMSVTFWNEEVDQLDDIQVGDIIKLIDLRARINREIMEITFQQYSSILPFDDPELAEIEVASTDASLETFLKIGQISEDKKNITITGKISRIYDLKTFKEGSGKLQTISVMDDTGLVVVKFWDDATNMLNELKEGDIVHLTALYPKYNDYSKKIELNAGKYTKMRINDEEDVKSTENISVPFILFAEVLEQTSPVFIKVRISRLNEVRTITRSDGTSAQVLNLEVIDEAGETGRLSAWDDDISVLEKLAEGEAYEVHYGRAKRDNYGVNVTVGRNTVIKPSEDFNLEVTITSAADYHPNASQLPVTGIAHLTVGEELVKIRGFVVKVIGNYIYESCSQCSKKLQEEADGTKVCPVHGPVESRMRMILTVTIDDSEETITVKFFGDKAEKLLGVSAQEAYELSERLNEDDSIVRKYEGNLLHKDLEITGRVIVNNNNNKEFNASWYNEIDLASETSDKLSRLEGL